MPARLPRLEQQTSLAERAYSELKTALLSGRFEPGSQLAEIDLAEALGISRTPVREALGRLRTEGLVVALPTGGNAVHTPSKEDDRELFLIREALEQLAVTELAKRTDPAGIAQLDRIIQEQERAKAAGNAERFLEADERFHFTICKLAGLNQTVEILTSLRQRMRLAGLGALAQTDRQSVVLAEHRAILKALRARDAARAARAVRRHLAATRAALNTFRAGTKLRAARSSGSRRGKPNASPPD